VQEKSIVSYFVWGDRGRKNWQGDHYIITQIFTEKRAELKLRAKNSDSLRQIIQSALSGRFIKVV